MTMGERELSLLVLAAECGNIGITRRYAKPWGDNYDTMKALEAQGLMQFASYQRDIHTGDFIRRSVITEAGRAVLRREVVEV